MSLLALSPVKTYSGLKVISVLKLRVNHAEFFLLFCVTGSFVMVTHVQVESVLKACAGPAPSKKTQNCSTESTDSQPSASQ